jgi:hypothetical protein
VEMLFSTMPTTLGLPGLGSHPPALIVMACEPITNVIVASARTVEDLASQERVRGAFISRAARSGSIPRWPSSRYLGKSREACWPLRVRLSAPGLPGRIEESFLQRYQALPPAARQLLLVAAAEPTGDPMLVWRAAGRLGITPGAAAAAAAEDDGLLVIGARMTFRHPLVRSAVCRAASLPEWRVVHQALAEATDPQADPDRRAWHLAQAAPGPD